MAAHVGRRHEAAKTPETLIEWTDGPTRLTRTDPRYSEANFLRAKAHYLARVEAVRRRGVMISGAGEIGKRIARNLKGEGVHVHAFLDLHPRRIGKIIAGAPVFTVEDMPPADSRAPVQLAAVGKAGRREEAAGWIESRGYSLGVDAFCAA